MSTGTVAPVVSKHPAVDEDWKARVSAVAASAAAAAASVDQEARFPEEAIGTAREQRIFGACVPKRYGGLGASIADVCELVEAVGRECASSAAVLAMHFSQELCLTRHIDLERDSDLAGFTKQVAQHQMLLASSTTEKGIGGDTRTSSCAVTRTHEGGIELRKSAPVISYGRFADAVLVTARRSAEAPPSEQVLVVVPRAHLQLERTSGWDALGLRGTMSEGFELEASVPESYILPLDFAAISAQSMLPASHTLWASSWLGLAAGAGDVARRFVQSKARLDPGRTPPAALRLAELEVHLQRMTDSVRAGVNRFESAGQDVEMLSSMAFAIAMNTLKVSASELVRLIVGDAMVIVGIAAYSNQGPLSLARALRDSIGPSLQVNNDRILHSTASLQLVSRGTR